VPHFLPYSFLLSRNNAASLHAALHFFHMFSCFLTLYDKTGCYGLYRKQLRKRRASMDAKVFLLLALLLCTGTIVAAGEYLGRYSANPYGRDSTANPYSAAGSPYSSTSVNNPYGSG
jgi:hypothetical protein